LVKTVLQDSAPAHLTASGIAAEFDHRQPVSRQRQFGQTLECGLHADQRYPVQSDEASREIQRASEGSPPRARSPNPPRPSLRGGWTFASISDLPNCTFALLTHAPFAESASASHGSIAALCSPSRRSAHASGCNTVAGAGRDIERGGDKIEDAARDVQRKM
jgi:hypothetical protein